MSWSKLVNLILRNCVLWTVFSAVAALGHNAPSSAPAVPLQKPAEDQPPSISLTPAVVMAKGTFGQGLTQTLSLSNHTAVDFAFDLVAEDVVIKDGKRVFVPAGETEHSIATSAVFSQKTITVRAFTT